MTNTPPATEANSTPTLCVRIGSDPGEKQSLRFKSNFRIGRVDECEVCIKDEHVSRVHAAVTFENDQWRVRDLQSANGIFIDGERVESALVSGTVTMRLGIYGPFVSLEVEESPRKSPAPPIGSETMMARYVDRYFGKPAAGDSLGEHTIMVRRAFQQVQKKERWKYGWVVASLLVALLAAGGYTLYLHRQVSKQKALAEDLFYSMKSLDLDIAGVEKVVLDSNNGQGREEIRKFQNRRKEMEKNYDRFLTTLRVYDPKLTEQQRLILRVARIFGECELAMPPDFVTEINNYIKKWQSSGRLARAVRTARENGYTFKIAQELLAQDLPPQFFYLALQESDFDPFISGPLTRKGIAKGMWQFIPETAEKYGLKIGPLVDLRRPDPADDRHHYDRATKAAASYLKDLYTTDAQASGFLVMACYNWGEGRVLPLVRSMPANPRERNFWRLLSVYGSRVPKETYDYVFYIVSAAVIGENPRLFGFDFDDPLAHLESR